MSKIAKTKLVGLAATFTAGPTMAADIPLPVEPAAIAPVDQYIISLTGGVMWSNFPQVNPVEGMSTPVPGFDADELGFGEDKFSVLPDNEIGGYGMLEVEKYNGDGAWDWRAAIQGTGSPMQVVVGPSTISASMGSPGGRPSSVTAMPTSTSGRPGAIPTTLPALLLAFVS